MAAEEDDVSDSSSDDDEDILLNMKHTMSRTTSRRSSVREKLATFTSVDATLDDEYMNDQCEEFDREMQDVAQSLDQVRISQSIHRAHQSNQSKGSASQSQAHDNYSSDSKDGVNVAFVCGANHYDELDDLSTPHSDVKLLSNRLQDQRYSVDTLVDKEVSKEGIIQKLVDLDSQAIPPGSNFVFHFSGHGKEEKLCMPYYSDRDAIRTSLSHTDLIRYMPKKFANVLVILDCCYAGSVEKLQNDEKLLSRIPAWQTIHVVSSTDSSVAIEDNFNGLFSSSLCRALRNSSLKRLVSEKERRVSFEKLFARIRQDVLSVSVRNVGNMQHPQLCTLSSPPCHHQSSSHMCHIPQLCRQFYFNIVDGGQGASDKDFVFEYESVSVG